jgi:hypothetical protein
MVQHFSMDGVDDEVVGARGRVWFNYIKKTLKKQRIHINYLSPQFWPLDGRQFDMGVEPYSRSE